MPTSYNVTIVFMGGQELVYCNVTDIETAEGVVSLYNRQRLYGLIDDTHLGSFPLHNIKMWRRVER